jgi:hypothetical protein
MKDQLPYGIGDSVTLVTDKEKLERKVVRITIGGSDVEYGVRNGSGDITWHSEFEMSKPSAPKSIAGFSHGTQR